MGYMEEYKLWLNSDALSAAEKAELDAIADDADEIESRFFAPLQFGTAGLRGTMGVGLNRMNVHVVRHTTQALAELICEEPGASRSAAVCFDSRNNSPEFAKTAACVLAANGVTVRLFDAMRPTPELSFAIRHYGLTAGINITASHNPKEYNGYKVYWSDGAQMPPDHSDTVAAKMEKTDIFKSVRMMDYSDAVSCGLIVMMGAETDEAFLKNVMAQSCDSKSVRAAGDAFRIVYTPFHGAGALLVPEAIKRLGVQNVYSVAEQMVPDGNFPTVVSPNPENPEGFTLAAALAKQKNAQIIIGTDPDADRVGVMSKDSSGEFALLTGNQTGALMLEYLINSKTRTGTMPKGPVALKTIVTTELARQIAERNGVECYDTFTGFKFMAEMKNALESDGAREVLFSFEESYGYMVGGYVRDKDAVTASMLIAEMSAWYFNRGMTLFDGLEELYKKYGYYGERTLNLMMPGLDGLANMAKLMDGLRTTPPAAIAGVTVRAVRDYQSGVEYELASGKRTEIELSGSNVLRFEMSDSSSIIVRPSGTEPKVKVYVLARGDNGEDCARRVDKYSKWAVTLG